MERRLAAILAADVVGYSRLMEADEEATLTTLNAYRHVIDGLIVDHRGRVFGSAGDSVVAEFASPVEAVRCAIAIQTDIEGRNADLSDDRRMRLRIGVNLGDVMAEGGNLFGDGVNIAARLEEIAEPGDVLISAKVHDEVDGKTDGVFVDAGEHRVKNIAAPIHVWRWSQSGGSGEPKHQDETLALPDKPSVAVLPFDNMSGDPEQEYFSDGITEDIITELSRFRELHVIARNSSFYYKGQAIKVQDVGRELGASIVVEGSVRKAGSRVRVTVQMVEAESGAHIWAERYDRQLEDIFAVQDEITQSIVAVLPNRLRSAMAEQVQRKSTESYSAYEYFLQGRWVYINSGGADPSAITLLDKAIDIDPTYAQAHAVLANLYAYSRFSLGIWYGDPETKARSYIADALKYGKNDSTIETLVGQSFYWLGEFDSAKFHLERAMQLNPHDIDTPIFYGATLSGEGNAEEGLRWIDKGLAMDPHVSDFSMESKTECLFMLREYQACLDIMLSWGDPPPHAYSHMAACYAYLGRMDEAHQAAARFRSLCAEDANFARYAANHANICKRQEDKDNWLNGYRMAGLLD